MKNISVVYTNHFVRLIKSLPKEIIEEALDKIDLFKYTKNHKLLKVHKLKGELKDKWSFSINYKYRIVFKYISKIEVLLLSIGDHSIYN